MAPAVLQTARVPAPEGRVGSDRVARRHAMTGRPALFPVLPHILLTMGGYAPRSGRGPGGLAARTAESLNGGGGKAAIGTGPLVVIGLLSAGPVSVSR
jgi:hypothetical protein